MVDLPNTVPGNSLVKQSPVDEQLLNIEASLGAAFEHLSMLEERLGSVVAAQPPSDAAVQSTVMNGSSSLVHRLAQINDKAITLERLIHDLTGRVEV